MKILFSSHLFPPSVGGLENVGLMLAEEFRAMRAEMSAQTSAIAGSITAARQAPPQVLLVPAPAVAPPAQKP